MAEPLFERLRQLLRDFMARANISASDIDEVEIFGGSSRIPFVKQIIASFFNREPKTTLNADDVVARGAALQCALLSPTRIIMEFSVVTPQSEQAAAAAAVAAAAAAAAAANNAEASAGEG